MPIKNIPRGDSRPYKFEFGLGVDITGWKIFFTVKENADDDDTSAIFQIITTAGDDVSDDVLNGKMTIWLESDMSSLLEPNVKYWYGFQRVLTVAGKPPRVTTLTDGTFTALRDITQTVT